MRVSLEDTEDPDLFHAAQCGLGAVGVVVGVGMRAEPVFKLEEEIFSMRFQDFTARWQEIAESAEHVRCWWFPQIARVKVSRLNRTDKVSRLGCASEAITMCSRNWSDVRPSSRFRPSLLVPRLWGRT